MSSFLVLKKKKLDLDSTSKTKMLVGKRHSELPEPSPDPSVPYDAQVEYLESTGTQWIDTKIIPTEKTSAQFKVYNKKWTGEVILGYSLENDNRDWRIFNHETNIYWDVMSSRLNTSGGGALNPGSWRELEVKNNCVKDLQTNQTLLSGSTVSSFTGDSTIKLDQFNNRLYSQNKWAYVKIYENNVLVRDMIPVRVGQIGYMYDKVSNKLFENKGTGDFVLGDDVNINLIAFANDGTVADSCFKCTLPSGYSPVGTTMTFWAKNLGRTSAMTVSNTDASFFFKIGTESNGVGLSWQIDNISNRLSLLKEAVTWQNTTASDLDSWHHYAIVYSSSSNILVYIDGTLKTSNGSSIVSPTDYFAICGYAVPAYIDGRYCIRTLNGSMARVAIFNSALTQAQVQADMELGATLPDSSSLQHLWAYSTKDEIGDWDLTQVSPAYIDNETPWGSTASNPIQLDQQIDSSNVNDDVEETPTLTLLKKHFDAKVHVDFDSTGGISCESAEYTLGQPYGQLPTTTKAQHIFEGWWTELGNSLYDAEVEYLESTGTQWIDTGIIPDSYTEVYAKLMLTESTSRGYVFAGTDKSGDPLGGYQVFRHPENASGNEFAFLVSYNNQLTSTLSLNVIHEVTQNQIGTRKLIVDGVDVGTFTGSVNVNHNLFLFTVNSNIASTTSSWTFKGRCYKCIIKNSIGIIIRDFIPVRVGNVGCMYDKVSGQLFMNQGSGNFTLGDDLPDSISEDTGTLITEESIVELSATTLYAHWKYVDIGNDYTEYIVQTTSSYKKTGIYSATRYDSSNPIVVDWDDGNVDIIEGNISQLAHEYSDAGIYHVKFNNTSTFQPSYSNSTWYTTTSQNRYTFKDVVRTCSHCTTFGTYEFYYCQALSSIDFLSSCFTNLTSIPDNSFYYCTSIPTLSTLPARIKTIGYQSFRNCTGLASIQDLRNTGLTNLPSSHSFSYCSSVKEWKLPSTLTATSLGGYLFYYNSRLSAINLPTSLTAIPTNCFYGCSQLKSIDIPTNVQIINSNAFYGNSSLTSVTYSGNALTAISDNAFQNCSQLTAIQLPNSIRHLGSGVFKNCYGLAGNLDFPTSLTSIGSETYRYCYNLRSMSIPSSVASIGDWTFAGCNNLSSISAYGLAAPSPIDSYATTFGNSQDSGEYQYTGYNSRGNNILYVYAAATGFDDGRWYDPLCVPEKCGFNVQYFDPENVHYCTITLDAGAGSVNPSTLSCVQGKKMKGLPTPVGPVAFPKFVGWYTGLSGSGTQYTTNSTAPAQSTLMLHAYFTEAPAITLSVDLNNSWEVNSLDNPDSNAFYMYQSYSNQYDEYNASLALMKIHISGYDQLSIWIRSYAESNYDYCVAFNADFDAGSTDWDEYTDWQFDYCEFGNLPCTKTTTAGNQNSDTSFAAYTLVVYQLDGGDHDIWVGHRKDGSVSEGDDRSYVLIPKN